MRFTTSRRGTLPRFHFFVVLITSLFAFPYTASAIEAEAGSLHGTAHAIINGGMSGGSGVGGIGSGAGNYLTLQLTGGSSTYAWHKVTVSYVSTTPRTLFWAVNGVAQRSEVLNSGPSGALATYEFYALMYPGPNALRFYNDAGVAPDIDQVTAVATCDISGGGGSSSGGGFIYEAESAVRSGTASVVSKSFMSGGLGVTNIGNGPANSVTFNNVQGISGAGNYTVLVAFSSGQPRDLFWSVNGGAGVSANMNSGLSSNVAGTYAIQGIALNAGVNSIRFYNDAGPAPDIDRIFVGRWANMCADPTINTYGHVVSSAPNVIVKFYIRNVTSPIVHYTVNGGAEQSAAMTYFSPNYRYEYSPTGLPAGAVVRYYYSAFSGTTPIVTPWGELTVPAPTYLAIQENTAGFCKVDGVVGTDHLGYTGAGFLDTLQKTGAGADWRINVGGGSYLVRWRYANGGGNRPAQLRVDGAVVASVDFPNTGTWDDWSTVELQSITLSAGTHNLRIQGTTQGGTANIDSIMVGGPNVTPVACR